MALRTFLFILVAAGGLFAQAPTGSWLERPLATWNAPATAVEGPPDATEHIEKDAQRCALAAPRDTGGERALAAGGWVPFHLFDRQIRERDIEIVGGLSTSDGMCRPLHFNAFVFVGGRFAGTLSPLLMDSRADGVLAGGIRIAADDTLTAEFSRYTDKDALCCPSARVRVRYRIDRGGTSPVVVPVDARPIR